MCGPTGSEKSLQSSSQDFSKTLQANFNQQFSNAQQVLGRLNTALSPITSEGPSQQGMSAQELAARNTQILNAGAAGNANARRAAQNAGAGQGGGASSGVMSGVQKQIQGEIASSSANQIAGAQENLTNENYAVGRDNYWKAMGGTSALAGQELGSASSAQGGAISENAQSFDQAKTIEEQQQQADQMIASTITSGVMGAATFGAGALGGGGFKGGLKALSGTR